MRCRCKHRGCWRVTARKCNYSAFNGYRWSPSDYSEVICDVTAGGCGARWRTKAAYVYEIPDADWVPRGG
jgi:hypothetical protein